MIRDPEGAIDALLQRLRAVEVERVDLAQAIGRVLAEPLVTDRPSPPCDVSSMDGYAVRLANARERVLPIGGEVRIGQPAPPLPEQSALKIVTGAPIPAGTDAVIRREDTEEHRDHIRIKIAVDDMRFGAHIRRRGENLDAHTQVIAAGCLIDPPVISAMAATGAAHPQVYRKLKVGVLTTGDELLSVDASPQPWQIRDSNGPALCALLSRATWIEPTTPLHAPDKLEHLQRALAKLLDRCDAVVMTGGVSMGDHDYVPQTVAACGGEVVFHKLPVRPGRPILGAVGPKGQAIVGLPGNPVSAIVGMCRMVSPMLRMLAGFSSPKLIPQLVNLVAPDGATLKLWWWRLVTLADAGQARLVDSRSSGDVISAARSDGFIEVPPEQQGAGPWSFYRWEI